MLNYQAIEIFTNEEARYQGKPVSDAVVEYVRSLKIPARCVVTCGIAGCYESGEVATGRLEILSLNLPIRICIVIPVKESKRVLDGLNGMVVEGIVALHDLRVLRHSTRNAFFPRQLRVRDVMTAEPASVKSDTPLSDAVRLLLPSIFTGLPVLDDQQRPIGVITQGDLIRKGGLPLRLGMLAESEDHRREAVLNQLASRKAAEAMTVPAVMIAQDRPLTEAVELMLGRDVKRLPVVDGTGCLAGMLSRLDIFRTVMREAPDWDAFKAQKVEVEHLKRVGDILRRDVHAVSPETKIDEVIQHIFDNDIQRVAVIDSEGKLLGLISDRDLLRYFKPTQKGIWHRLAKVKHPFEQDACRTGDLRRCLSETNAASVMNMELTTVAEEMLIEDAIGIMIEKGLKRLPVVDSQGRFAGMISRDSLLRTGFGSTD